MERFGDHGFFQPEVRVVSEDIEASDNQPSTLLFDAVKNFGGPFS
jgi:hypothetical protein